MDYDFSFYCICSYHTICCYVFISSQIIILSRRCYQGSRFSGKGWSCGFFSLTNCDIFTLQLSPKAVWWFSGCSRSVLLSREFHPLAMPGFSDYRFEFLQTCPNNDLWPVSTTAIFMVFTKVLNFYDLGHLGMMIIIIMHVYVLCHIYLNTHTLGATFSPWSTDQCAFKFISQLPGEYTAWTVCWHAMILLKVALNSLTHLSCFAG